jgi:hypothetical protein
MFLKDYVNQTEKETSESYLQFHSIDRKFFRVRKSFMNWINVQKSYKAVVVRNFLIFIFFDRHCLHGTY